MKGRTLFVTRIGGAVIGGLPTPWKCRLLLNHCDVEVRDTRRRQQSSLEIHPYQNGVHADGLTACFSREAIIRESQK